MVTARAALDALLPPGFGSRLLAAADAAQPVLLRLDPQRRAKVMMALVALVLLGAFLVALAYLGGRRLRRMARKRTREVRPTDNDWYRKPLVPPASAAAPHEPEGRG
ncbi:MAG: hypothetical protein AB7O59_00725 [Pirellulales bacterium]